MTILKCSAVKCMYNDNELCSRGDIEITGANARHAEDTTCGSFRDRNSSGSAMNCTAQHCGCEKINIDCKAQDVPTTTTANVQPLPLMFPAVMPQNAAIQNVIPSPVSADLL